MKKKAKKSLKLEENAESPIPYKKIKLEVPDLPEDDFQDVLHDLETSRDDLPDLNNCESEPFWIKELGLKVSDKELIVKNKKLTSKHMEAVNTVFKNQFKGIKGFQLTEKVPKFIENESRWHIGTVMDPVDALHQNSGQIHHTGKDHWVTSICHNNTIFFIRQLRS